MKLLWSKDLKLNTVHVEDVSRACWYLTQWYIDNNVSASGTVPIFNLVDKQDTGKLSSCLCACLCDTNMLLCNNGNRSRRN
jgi:hypothetical protein